MLPIVIENCDSSGLYQLPGTIPAIADVSTLAANGVNDTFDAGFLDGRRRFFQCFLADDAATSRRLDRLAPSPIRQAFVGNVLFFGATLSEQTDFFLVDTVLELRHLLDIGNQTAHLFQLAASAVDARPTKHARLTGQDDSQPEKNRQQEVFHGLSPKFHGDQSNLRTVSRMRLVQKYRVAWNDKSTQTRQFRMNRLKRI